jgi:tetraacyldisaccharide 4'-kinase
MSGSSLLEVLEHKVAAVMASTERFPLLSLATALSAGEAIYGAGVRLRGSLYEKGVFAQHKLPCPIVSIGNLVAGGSGKTPLTIHLARLLQALGRRVIIVSRGYKGEEERRGTVVSDGRALLSSGRQAGDEPFLMANLLRSVPVVVGRDRWVAAHEGLTRFGPDIILLDDAFQHRRLARDLNLVLMDFQAPLGNGHLLPRGTLREPASAIERADAVIFTRSEGDPTSQYWQVLQCIHPRPFFHARHLPVVRRVVPAGESPAAAIDQWEDQSVATLQGRSLFAFAGLARNREFYHTIERSGGRLLGTMGFADHYPYQPYVLERIVAEAQGIGCESLVTSDKDFVRLPAMALPLDLIVLGIDIDFGADAASWRRFIEDRVARAGGSS